MTSFLLECAADSLDQSHWTIKLSNGKTIEVKKNPTHDGKIWGWKVDTQIFSQDETALRYLKKLITEKLTGKRIIFHERYSVPTICGVNGAACRAPGQCNTALCLGCPVAEQFFADRDGVELIYAIGEDRQKG